MGCAHLGLKSVIFVLLIFVQDLVRSFNFHNYDNLRHTPRKNDPRVQTVDQQANLIVNLIFSAYNGDVTAIRR